MQLATFLIKIVNFFSEFNKYFSYEMYYFGISIDIMHFCYYLGDRGMPGLPGSPGQQGIRGIRGVKGETGLIGKQGKRAIRNYIHAKSKK